MQCYVQAYVRIRVRRSDSQGSLNLTWDLGGSLRGRGANPGVVVLGAFPLSPTVSIIHGSRVKWNSRKRHQRWRVKRLVILDSSEGAYVFIWSRRRHKGAEMTSPGRQVSLMGFTEGWKAFYLPSLRTELGALGWGVTCLWSSLWPNVFQCRLPLTLVLLALGSLPPFLWFPFLNLFLPGGGSSA